LCPDFYDFIEIGFHNKIEKKERRVLLKNQEKLLFNSFPTIRDFFHILSYSTIYWGYYMYINLLFNKNSVLSYYLIIFFNSFQFNIIHKRVDLPSLT